MGVIDPKLITTYRRMREEQAKLFGKPRTPIDRLAEEHFLRVAFQAIQDVATDRRDARFRVCSMPTGYGKTTAAIAFLAALAQHGYTGAMVVPTIELGQDIVRDLEALTGPGYTLLFTELNSPSRNEEQVCLRHNLTEDQLPPVVSLQERRQYPLLITTHAMWTYDLNSETGLGVRDYEGGRRHLVVVDESPNLLSTSFCLPQDVDALLVACRRHEEDAELAEVLARVAQRMNAIMLAARRGSGFHPIALVAPEEVGILRAHPEERVCRFLALAYEGFAFFDAQHVQFVIYALDLPDGCSGPGPGHVLLDATADLSNMEPLFEGGWREQVPMVNYSRLAVTHIPHPDAFQYMPDVAKKLPAVREYAAWVRTTVLAYTAPGESVLVVVPKGLIEDSTLRPDLNAGKLPRTTMGPVDWDGRRVFIENWGTGMGTNDYRTAEAVFLFSEFHLPAHAYVAQHLGYRRRPMTQHVPFRLRRSGEEALTGPYADAKDRHLLRWTKQLACRGNVRNIDGTGRCGPMRLYTTMDRRRLQRYWPTLFPGAPEPVFMNAEPGPSPSSGLSALADLLWTSRAPGVELYSKQIEAETGIPSRDLRRKLDSPSVAEAKQGWEFVPARGQGRQAKLVYRGTPYSAHQVGQPIKALMHYKREPSSSVLTP